MPKVVCVVLLVAGMVWGSFDAYELATNRLHPERMPFFPYPALLVIGGILVGTLAYFEKRDSPDAP